MAAVSAEGSTVWVLIRRLNSSWSRSMALVVRALFHWLTGNRVKVNSRSPASSRLAATTLHLSRHLRMKARRRTSISAAAGRRSCRCSRPRLPHAGAGVRERAGAVLPSRRLLLAALGQGPDADDQQHLQWL